MTPVDPLTGPIEGADRREVGGATVDIVRAGTGRVKRAIARGRIQGEYADGCTFEYAAPQVVVVEPGHDAWVVGDEAAVLIQFDAEKGTARRFGLPAEHGRHH
jgi:streptogramin lyase